LIGIGALVLIFVLYVVYALFIATPVSPPDVVEYSNQGLEITIDYSRPYKKGRVIFGTEADSALQPYGQYWRLGANAPTEITVNQDVLLGGQPLEAGTYRMYAVPGADSFKLTLNSDTGGFFAFSEPDYELNIFSIDAPVTRQSQVTEQFTINIENEGSGARIDFSWDDLRFSVPVTVP
jgi:hypothetical protein